jgi:hypothetical protein
MKLTTGILAMAMMVGGAWAQNPDAIDNARSTAKSLQQNQANPAPKAVGVSAASKPAPGAPAPAVKPAAIPGSTVVAAKPASSSQNQLQRVNVVPGADGVAIEISSSQAVTPRVSKLSSPDRVVVELPETVVASSTSKIPVGSAGVKGVRIGMDGKTPPTTSVVVDLEKPLAYEVTPGADGKIILRLHSQEAAPSVAKNSPAPAAIKTVKVSVPAARPAASEKPATAPAKIAVVKAPASKPVVQASKPEPQLLARATPASKIAAPAVSAPSAGVSKSENAAKQSKAEEKKWSMSGKRDPFFSPVVQANGGSGCSTGKKCLEINGINLRGVVKSDGGFIAVVTNNMNKAYFLRENDPVFNGYVVKITGDSVVFQETMQDKLGKPFTREIVKRIFTPAV